MKWGKVPIFLIIRTVQREVGGRDIRVEDGMTANNNEVLEAGVVSRGHYVFWMDKVLVRLIGRADIWLNCVRAE